MVNKNGNYGVRDKSLLKILYKMKIEKLFFYVFQNWGWEKEISSPAYYLGLED